MPLGVEAKEFTAKCVLNRRVKVRCYSRDQYGRVVGTVQFGWRGQDLSEELLRRGLASVYRSAGAVYAGRGPEYWDALEATAQRKRWPNVSHQRVMQTLGKKWRRQTRGQRSTSRFCLRRDGNI